MTLSLYSIPSLFAILALILLFFYALKKSNRTPGYKLLLCIVFHSLIYMVCECMLVNTTRRPWALFWDKTIYYAIPVIVSNYLHLALVYRSPCKNLKGRPFLLALIYLPAIFFIGLLPTDLLISGLQPEYWGWGKVEGPFYGYFRLFLMVYFWGAILTILIRRHNADPISRNGLTFLGVAFCGPIVVTTIVTAVLQPLGINDLNIMIHPLSLIYSAWFLYYAIAHQHILVDMQLLLAPAIKTRKYRFHQRVKGLIREIHGHNLNYQQIVTMLQDVLKCPVGLNIDGQPVATSGGNAAFAQAKLEALDQEIILLNAREEMLRDEAILMSRATFANFDTLYENLEVCGIEAVLPIYDDGQVLGSIKFGQGFSEKIYSKQDYQLMTTLWSQLVVALKYIRKLEEQLAVKDRIITKLNRKIRFLQTDFRTVSVQRASGRDSFPSVWIGPRNKAMPPIANCAQYECLKTALAEGQPSVVIVDGEVVSHKLKQDLRTLNLPLLFIGPVRSIPKTANSRLIDVMPSAQINNRLAPAVRFMGMLHGAVRFEVNDTDFVTHCPKLIATLEQIQKIAPLAKAILLNGETGTGKELIAAYIGQICKKKMVSVNCAAISKGLFESAFFGHERGAFTGADRRHKGYLEQARNGILFLDEISELPMELQAKLLRILEGGTFQRLGSQRLIRPKVQFVFASNRNLKALADRGLFREDLLYRLDQLAFNLPPLRHRREDIPLLAGYYLMRHKIQYGMDARINAAAMASLKAQQWPGNVRELSNAVLKMIVDVQNDLAGCAPDTANSLTKKVKSFEAALIHESLARSRTKSTAAKALGIPLSTLRSKLKNMDPLLANWPVDDIQQGLNSCLNLPDQVRQYERLLIRESLMQSASQSNAAHTLGIPLSTLRSKIKKLKIEVGSGA